MHVCLLIDLLTLCWLVHGLRFSGTVARKLLCLGCLIYLLAISLHYYLVFAPWFGLFQWHRGIAAIGMTELLDLFGGFWTFFGVMVFAKAVSTIVLLFVTYNTLVWLTKPRARQPQPAATESKRLR